MRFLLDENIHRGLLPFLTGLGHDVSLCLKGLTNGDVLTLAVSERRALITHDEDFAAQRIPSAHTGIILVKILPLRLESLKRSLEKLLAVRGLSGQWPGKLVMLFEDRYETFPP